MKTNKIKTDYFKAVDRVSNFLDFIHNNFTPNEPHPETRAAVCHWLMNNGAPVPHLDARDMHAAWVALSNFDDEFTDRGRVSESDFQAHLDLKFNNIPFPPPEKPKFTFIDLFAGIGGIRLPFQELGGKCILSSEWDASAKKTYSLNFGEIPYGDITKIKASEIPNHDILLAGFPCQAFSIAGYREGFADKKGRGNLFFDIYRILKEKQPKAFLLENVKNLKGHDGGNTFRVITEYLEEAGYDVSSRVLNAMEYGNVPQNRERIYIVGFLNKKMREKNSSEFVWPQQTPLKKNIKHLFDETVDEYFYYKKYDCYEELKKKVTSRETVYQWRRMYVRENKSGVCPTLTANMGTGGHNVPIILDKKDIRKLTPKECFRVQGYPEEFKIPQTMAMSRIYKQIGNSVTVPVIQRIAKSIIKKMNR